jgi:hypothetical protein
LAAQHNEPPPPAAYALQGVTVVQADGSMLAGVNVVIRGGMIEAMGADLAIPADAELLAGDSLYIYPGIVDAQGEAEFEFPEIEVDRSEIASWDPPRNAQGFMPHRRVVDYLTETGPGLAEQRKSGVVAAAVLAGDRMLPGSGTVLVFRKDAEVPGALVAHPVLGQTASLRGAQGVYPGTLFGVMAFYRQTFEDARHQQAHIQAYDRNPQGVTPPTWDPDLQAVRDMMAGSTPVFFAADFGRDIQKILGLAEEYGFRPVIVGGDEAWKVADEIEAANVPVLVSLDFPKPERWKPAEDEEEAEPGNGNGDDLDAAAQREKQELEDLYSNAGRLADAGVTFALTSGGGEADMLEGARKAIEYGLSEQDALRALTSTPASLLGIGYVVQIQSGMSATFVVTDGPLFDEETAISYTFVEGAMEKGKEDKGSGEEPTVDVTGTWDFEIDAEGETMEAKLVLTQEGASVEGSMESQFGTATVTSGSVSGNEMNLTISFSMGGEGFTLEVTGSVEGDDASGTGDFPMGSFTWTAKRTGGPGEEN